jgi:hypothetical protein
MSAAVLKAAQPLRCLWWAGDAQSVYMGGVVMNELRIPLVERRVWPAIEQQKLSHTCKR